MMALEEGSKKVSFLCLYSIPLAMKGSCRQVFSLFISGHSAAEEHKTKELVRTGVSASSLPSGAVGCGVAAFGPPAAYLLGITSDRGGGVSGTAFRVSAFWHAPRQTPNDGLLRREQS